MFRIFFSESPDAMFRTSKQGIFIAVNPAFINLLGYSEKILFDNYAKIIFLKKIDHYDFLKQIHKKGYVQNLSVVLKKKNGDLLNCTLDAKIISDKKGHISEYQGIIRDNTSQLRWESQILKTKEFYRTLFDESPIPLWYEDFSKVKLLIDKLKKKRIKDFSSYLNRKPEIVTKALGLVRIIDVNKAACNLHSAPTKDHLKMGLATLFGKSSLQTFILELQAIWDGVNSFEFDTRIKTFKGEVKYIHVKWNVVPGCEKSFEKIYISTMDISDRKYSEEKLRQSKETFRKIFHDNQAVMLLINPNNKQKIIDVNHAGLKYYGYQRKDLLNMNMGQINTLPEKTRLRQMEKTMNKKENYYQCHHRLANGTLRDVEVYSSPITIRNKSLAFVIVHDITRKKQLEESLSKQIFFLEESQKASNIGSYELDLKADQWTSSKTLNKIFGITNQFERTIDGWISLIHPDDRQMIYDHFQNDVLKNFHRFDHEYRIIQHNKKNQNKIRSVHGLGNLRFNQQGEPVGLVGTIQDITDRKIVETSLITSEMRYRSLVEDSPTGIFYMNRKGFISEANSRLLQILGSPSMEMTKRINLFTLPQLVKSGFTDALTRCIATLSVVSNEHYYKSKWGKVSYIRYILNPITDGRGNVQGVQGNVEDITETIELEQQLRQSQKMEAVGQLAGGVAHDFNNLLAGILGNAELMKMEAPKNSPLSQYSKTIIEKTTEGGKLIQQLLAFSRQQVLNIKPINLNDTIWKALEFIKKGLSEEISFKTQLSNDNAQINGDETAINQMLTNLCLNARDAMPDGGVITIVTKNIKLGKSIPQAQVNIPAGDYLVLSISDNGFGMEKEIMDNIFNPFFTTKKVGHGTGLGLSMVYGLMKQHKGFVFCSSKPDVGTTFDLYFPISSYEPETKSIKNDSSDLTQGSGTILIIEDDMGIMSMATQALKIMGYTILSATDGDTAMEVFNQNKLDIDLILTDIVLPGKSGLDLYYLISQYNRNIKFVFMTGFAGHKKVKELQKHPDLIVLNKPFKLKELSDTIKNVMG